MIYMTKGKQKNEKKELISISPQKTVEIIMNSGNGTQFTGSAARQHLLLHLRGWFNKVELVDDGVIFCDDLRPEYKYGSEILDQERCPVCVKAIGTVSPSFVRRFIENTQKFGKVRRVIVASKMLTDDGYNFCKANYIVPVAWDGEKYVARFFDMKKKEEKKDKGDKE